MKRCVKIEGINLTVEKEQEEDGRWRAEVPELPGVLVCGPSREEAVANVEALALRVMAERIEHGEAVPEMTGMLLVVG